MAPNYDLIGKGLRFPLAFEHGRVALARGQDELFQAIQIILGTPVGARVMRPAFGCRIHELVFAPLNASTLSTAEHYIRDALAYWEPRIELIEVQADLHPDLPATMVISVSYEVKATYDQRTLVFPFYTIPEHER